MSKLAVGVNVDIQRTNGRIHSAVVSTIDWAARSVTVEWSEAEEIKGKEIDFESIFTLNPNLNDVQMAAPSGVATRSTRKQIQAPRQSTSLSSSKGSLRVRNQAAANNRLTMASNGNSHSQNGFNSNSVSSANYVTSESQIPTKVAPSSSSNALSAASGAANKGLNSHLRSSNKDLVSNILKEEESSKNRRRSNVVKQVDQIAKQREERRERQEQQRREKVDLIAQVEPGNNQNWEFLSMIREFRSNIEFKPMNHSDNINDIHTICVAVRKRPMNKKELSKKDVDVITIPNKNTIIVHEPKQKVDLTRYLENHNFRFDFAFDQSADNELVYKFTAKPLVATIFEGGMATCFAYGQTGSGKTHTMGGDFSNPAKSGSSNQDSARGIYGLAAKDVFKLFKSNKYKNDDLKICASFFEIYSGKVFDLLNNKSKLRVLEDAKNMVQVVGLQEKLVESVDDVIKLIATGNNIRTSGTTSANNHSSRSHAVFQLMVKKVSNNKLKGKFSLIDLAGNERGADTSSSDRTTRMEGAEINKSLLALKECIRALGRRSQGAHLPFRASKLTQVLRDSFIGENSRTCMIAMISPGTSSCEHSLNTLRYADRVKELGAESPEMKTTEDEADDEDEAMSTGGDDLALLHSHNANEFPDEIYNFQQAISHIHEAEEEILDLHKAIYDNIPKWNADHERLLRMTNDVDYDVDLYAQQLESVISIQAAAMATFREKVSNFRAQLAEEEIISKKILKK